MFKFGSNGNVNTVLVLYTTPLYHSDHFHIFWTMWTRQAIMTSVINTELGPD